MADHRGNHIRELFQKYLAGQCSAQELDELLVYFDLYADSAELRRLVDGAMRNNMFSAAEEQAIDSIISRNEATILQESGGDSKSANRWRIRQWLPYAAAIFIAVTAATWLLYGDQILNHLPAAGRQGKSNSVNAQDIAPGGNRATLTLADGTTVDLSSEHEGIIIQDGITYLDGSQVMENGELKMENERPGEENGILNSQFSILNSITTPKGGTYQITLPDGSKVWLNANSTLKYPSRFAGDSREVILDGEAYFDISEQVHGRLTRSRKTPFRVITNGQIVEVLGTEFNVSAYPDEPETKTTLVEGSVRLLANGGQLQLVPGEQGMSTDKGFIKVDVDVSQSIAWKSGRFSFDGKSFAQVMAELSRWYDLDIVYTGPVPQQRFFGDAFRDENLSVVLKLLQSARIDYGLTGKTLTIRTRE